MSECFQRQSRKNFEFCSHKNCTLTRRSDTPIPSGGIRFVPPPRLGRLSSAERQALAPAEHLVPIKVPDENEESSFWVVPAIDLTEDD